MTKPTVTFLIHGAEEPPTPPRRLRAGPVTLDYQSGDLRDVTLAGREVLRRLYGAVRDQNWATIPGTITGEVFEVTDSTFRIRYVSEHRQGDIWFVWKAELSGDDDGTLRFVFDGEAKSSFLRNRIGLCVLHPIPECTGAKARALLVDGSTRELVFPKIIAAEQPVHGFDTLAGLAHEITPELWAEVRFTGDVFETEDQRNWIDASFKTYCTPSSLPKPVQIQAGDRVRQSIEVRPLPRPDSRFPTSAFQVSAQGNRSSIIDLKLGIPAQRLPDLGLGSTSHRFPLDDVELRRLAAVNINHLRVDVRLAEEAWREHFLAAARSANALGLPLELVVHLPADGRHHELSELRRELTRLRADVSRVFPLQEGQRSTTSSALRLSREHLGDLEVPIGAGTDGDLYQLNLQRPPADADFIFWTMNPQVHARDTRSMMETPGAAAAQIASVRSYYPNLPLVVSSITLRPRFNTAAVGPETALPDTLPPQVDPRQMTLAGAAWTVGMLAALTPSGVESLTFFETSGWRGVLETGRGSFMPDRFPSSSGEVFPVWHVLAALNGFRSVAAGIVSDPRRVASFTIADREGQTRTIVANLTPESVEVRMESVLGTVRILDESNVVRAMRQPEEWWRQETIRASRIKLSAYAVAFVDIP